MAVVPVQILGPTYPARSVQFSSQATKNMYAEIEPSGRNAAAYMPWPGTVEFGVNGGADRGQYVFQQVLYKVNGTTLYSVDSDGAFTPIGPIGGLDRCVFADDGDKMIIVTNGLVYLFDGALSTITDPLLVNPQSVTVLNKQAIYDTGVGGQFAVANVGDPATLSAANTAIAESNGDALLRCYSFGQRVYFMGLETIEPWYNSGVGNPPFERIDTGIIQIGLGALHSVSNTDNFVYFLGDDLNIYQMRSNQVDVVSNNAIAGEIQSFTRTDDAIGYDFDFQGQNFYVITFPSEDITYVYSEQIGEWSVLESFGGRYIGQGYSRVYDKHILADRRSGGLVAWDFDVFTDVGETIIRSRTSKVVSGEAVNKPRARLIMRWVEFLVQTGLGLPDGQGSNPKLMVDMSFDGGHTFEKQRFIPIGRGGQFTGRVRADNMDSFYDAVFRVSFSDPVFFSLQGASIEVDTYGY